MAKSLNEIEQIIANIAVLYSELKVSAEATFSEAGCYNASKVALGSEVDSVLANNEVKYLKLCSKIDKVRWK